MSFPSTEQVAEQVIEQVTEQVKRLVTKLSDQVLSTSDLLQQLNLKHRPTFIYDYLKPALYSGFVEMTIPDKPNSRLQKYRLTIAGRRLLELLLEEKHS